MVAALAARIAPIGPVKRLLSYYRSRTQVLVGYDFHSEGGAWRSIYRYFRRAEGLGQPVMLIDRCKQGTFRQLAAAVLLSPRLLFNGLGAFYRWEGVCACLLRPDCLIYLHDTAYMLKGFARQHPLKFRLFRIILRRNPILCVSEQMENYYRKEWGTKRTHVVREAIELPAKPDFEPGYRHIVMVGTMDERKGVKLFSAVAEQAEREQLPWKFHWIGSLASQSLEPPSQAVHWWGWQDGPGEFIGKADLFFLSSVDDPLPLACLEAMALGKRCVAYKNTGIAEMIGGIQGCAVYEDYSMAAAFAAVKAALGVEADSKTLARLTREKASVASLADKIQQIAGI